jgi:hypothetical protein
LVSILETRGQAKPTSKLTTTVVALTAKKSIMGLPYRQVPEEEDDEARGEEEKPFLSDEDEGDELHAKLRPSLFRKHQILILRCLLLASCVVNIAFVGVYSWSRTLVGPQDPIFPQALYCMPSLS